MTGITGMGRTATVLLRGSNKMVLEEADRSLHDALCVIRCLVNKRFMIAGARGGAALLGFRVGLGGAWASFRASCVCFWVFALRRPLLSWPPAHPALPSSQTHNTRHNQTAGGAAPEAELNYQLSQWSKTLTGMESFCVRGFAEALDIVPYTLAENAGLNPIQIVTELRNLHASGEKYAGLNVRKGTVTNMLTENVVQPLLVTTSALTLATECVRMLMKIDDIVPVR